MSDYEQGFRAGIEAAAQFIESGWRSTGHMGFYEGPKMSALPAALRALPVPAAPIEQE